MKIHQIPLWRDNYGYLIVCEKTNQAAIVDPSEADPVLRRIDETTLGAAAIVTDIGHSRTVVRIVGAGARELLNRGLPVDLDPSVFPSDAIAQSVIHHMPVLVHRAVAEGDDAFDAYVTREYAVSFWEWLTEAAQSFGCEIRKPE